MSITESLRQPISDRDASGSEKMNVSPAERWASAVGGGALLAYGATHRSWNRAMLMAAGGGLLYRAITGQCQLYKMLGINHETERGSVTSVRHGEGVKFEHAVIVNRPPEELYRFWRSVENLPTFMEQLEEVRRLNDGRSHWVVKGPGGKNVEWDAEIHNEIPNQLIAWRSLESSDVNHAGSVHFRGLRDGRTEVRVVMSYEPPFGRVGSGIIKLLGEDPGHQLEHDLWRFKQMMESLSPSAEIKQRSI
jgi:uncharacterized membrane protein